MKLINKYITYKTKEEGEKMIRDFNLRDEEELVKIVKQGVEISEQEIINYVTGEDIKIIVYEDHELGLQGFSSLEIWDKAREKGELILYVVPYARRRGIGTLLYNEIMKCDSDNKLTSIDTRIRVDKDDASSFYQRLNPSSIHWIVIDLSYKR
jgi:GNAT superfamily N-acetyltransferase